MDPVELVGHQVDRLISVEPWLKLQGRLHILQEASQHLLGMSMTYAAAKKLAGRVRAGDVIMVCTGFVVANDNVCETDGPVGAAALARALKIGFNATPILITDEASVSIVSAACRGMGLNLQSDAESVMGKRHAAHVMGFPLGDKESKEYAARLLDRYKPDAVITIERPGKNIKGVHHSFRGQDISATSAKIDYLYEMARDRKVLTIGIGDVGNELGTGNIRETVLENVPYARQCQCPCGAGTACAVNSDVVLIAAVSNWGGSGVAALLSALTERPDVPHSGALEKRTIRECADAGAIDGETGRCEPTVDGISDELHGHIVKTMAKIVESGLSLKRKEHPIPKL